ncbi:MAG: NADH-quinone oxidoreductase subunit J [Desulfurivibrionaceae bacterium]
MNPTLFSLEGFAGVMFLLFAGLIIVGALIATCSRRLIRSVSGLALCFVGVAGIYYFLGSPFVALMEILVYIGAVCVTITFAIMLAEPEEGKLIRKSPGLSNALGFLVAGAVALGLITAAVSAKWEVADGAGEVGTVKQIGLSLLTEYSMVFELVSIVLLIAIIGSLALARAGRDKDS